MKDGAKAGGRSREETAHFAACYSSAWKGGHGTVDVYAMRREQVSKSTGKGSLGTGSFLLKGEREWHRNIPLKLVFFMKEGVMNVAPGITAERIGMEGPRAEVSQGDKKKSDAAKQVAGIIGCQDLDYIMRQLPPDGGFNVSKGG